MADGAPRYLVDNSVWSRLASNQSVADAFRSLATRANPTAIYLCPATAAEYGYSARSGADHTRLLQQLSRFVDCPIAPTSADALQLQNALWTNGLLRAVGVVDTLIAAYAIANHATVVHYDSDFDHIASVRPEFQHQWIVPRGTL